MKTRKDIFKLSLLLMSIAFTFSCEMYAQQTLKDAFKGYFYIGTALNEFQVTGRDPKTADFVVEQFNSITPENLLKWQSVNPAPGKFNFAPADSFVAFGERHHMFIIGHTLVWHSQTPKWVFEDNENKPLTREQLLQRMKEHILEIAGRYKGRINGWDVVNEAIEDNGELRNSKWRQIIGDDFIEKAFEYAHEADPNMELYYNDYNTFLKPKRERIIKLVKDLQAKGIRIDGIGMQGHWGLDYPPLNELDETLKEFAATGVKIMITELDLDILPNPMNNTGADVSKRFKLTKESNPYADGLPDSVATVEANRYADFFKLFVKYKDSIERVTFWGVNDKQSWRNNWPIFGRSAYPLLFDANNQPKKAFYSVIETVKGK